jgi:hypothetical protein
VSRHVFASGAFALALAVPQHVLGATDADLAEIRNQIRDLKADYEARIRALESRLRDAEARAAAPTPSPAAPGSSSSAFNPAISAILNGTYEHTSERRGFSLGESELVLSANADPHFAGKLVMAVTPDDTVEVEEAYGQWTSAPFGMVPRFGRFLSGVGYLNEQHAHAWDFVDAPLPYQFFLDGQHKTDGLQVKWVAPTETFIELGGEAGNSSSGAAYAHVGGDIGADHSWRAGASYLRTRPEDDLGIEATTKLAIADFVWKYAPNGNPRETNFKLQGEYFSGRVREAARESGWYLQGVYQFHPEWRAGVRYERRESVHRSCVMVDYNPSEFSRIRLQFSRSQMLADVTDNQFFVQYILSLGAHGAHRY